MRLLLSVVQADDLKQPKLFYKHDHCAVGYTFLPRDASAERGNATVSRPSVCPSVRDV